MEKVKSISRFQLFSIMFISTVFFSMMYSVYIMQNMSLLTYALSAVAAGVCMFLLTLPLVGFRKKFDEGNIIKSVQVTKPALSPIFAYLYSHCFIYSAGISLAVFALLISNFINSSISFIVFLAAAVMCCYYAGSRGIVSIARSGSMFFLLTVLSLLFIGVSLSYKINILNYSEIYLTSVKEIANNTILLIGQAFCVPAVFLFCHRTKGSLGKGIRLWAILSYVAVAVIGFVSYGVLGEYLHLTPFPFYTAAQLTEIGAFQRLDALFLAILTIGLFVNVSLSMYALRETIQSSVRAEKAKFLNPLSAIIVGILAWVAVKFDWLRNYLFDARVMIVVFLTVTVILPVVALMLMRKKHIPNKAVKAGVMLTLAMLFIPLLTGCNSVQLQERMLIKGIGIDKTDEGYSLTLQYLDNFSDDEGQSNKAVKVEGESIAEAMSKISRVTGNEPFLGQNVALIVGWETAQGNVRELLDYFVRYGDSRPTTKLYISEGSAEEILTLEVGGTLIPIDQISMISLDNSDNLFTLLSFIIQSDSGTDTPAAAVLAVDETEIKQTSVAVFDDEQGIFKLSDEQLFSYQIINGIARGEAASFDKISCSITGSKSFVTSRIIDGVLHFNVSAEVEMSVSENPGNVSVDEVEKLFNHKIAAEAEQGLNEVLKERGCDIYNFGKNLRFDDYRTYSSGENYSEELSKCVTNVNVKCKVTNM